MSTLDDTVAALSVKVDALVTQITQYKLDLATAVNAASTSANNAQIAAVASINGAAPRAAIAGGNFPANSLVYPMPNSLFGLANVTIPGAVPIGFTKNAYLTAQTMVYYVANDVMSGFTNLVPNTDYYLSIVPGTVGTRSSAPQVAGQGFVCKIGRAISTTEILFNPEPAFSL